MVMIMMMKNLIPCFPIIKRSMPSHDLTPVFHNFNSLFLDSLSEPDPQPQPQPEPEPDFAAAIASRRFFFSSPGRSNSIIHSSSSISTIPEDTTGSSMLVSPTPSHRHSMSMEDVDEASSDSVVVHTNSPDPYADFRRSMEEMVEARRLHDAKANWDKLHELLLCYLALNPKSTHRIIVRAFADLLVTLMYPTEDG